MKTTIEKETLYLIPEEDLVASNIENLRNYFIQQLKEHENVSSIILDASGIDIIDSLGVNLIIGLYRQVTSQSKSFEIIQAGEKFIKVAEFFRFPALFKVHKEEI